MKNHIKCISLDIVHQFNQFQFKFEIDINIPKVL